MKKELFLLHWITGWSTLQYKVEWVLQVLAEELKCDVSEVADFELNVYDTQPGCIGGARDDFVFAGRLDNLASAFCALWAFLDTCADPSSLVDESSVRMIALFDSGEVLELLIFDHEHSSYHFIALTSYCSLTY